MRSRYNTILLDIGIRVWWLRKFNRSIVLSVNKFLILIYQSPGLGTACIAGKRKCESLINGETIPLPLATNLKKKNENKDITNSKYISRLRRLPQVPDCLATLDHISIGPSRKGFFFRWRSVQASVGRQVTG